MSTTARTAVVPTSTTDALTTVEQERVERYVGASLAPETRRAYASQLRGFRSWCEPTGRESCPASGETLAAYLTDQADAGRSVSGLSQLCAAVRWEHLRQGHATPTAHPGVASTMAGIRRTLGTAPKRRKAPATVDRLAAMGAHVDRDSTKGIRDALILLLGFASAMRRSELVALEVADLEPTDKGFLVTVRRGKTDQEGRGHVRAILPGQRKEPCPVEAIWDWYSELEAGGVALDDHTAEWGRLFRSVDRHGRIGESLGAAAVADVVKHYAKLAGLDPAEFGGHSLRAGFVTSAAERGASVERIADHTGHKNMATVRIYTRRSDAFADHAGAGLL